MRTWITTFLVLGSLAGSAAADILVVDGVGALLDHYATIQEAVDAAAPGDTVLMQADIDATSESVVVDGKGFRLLVDTDQAFVEIAKLTITGVPAGQVMTVRGLEVQDPADVAMFFEDNPGRLRLYDVRGVGNTGLPQTRNAVARPGSVGAYFTNCADVLMKDSGFGGGKGGKATFETAIAPSDGGIGAIVTNSNISAFQSGFGGGWGGAMEQPDSTENGGTGGVGLVNDGSTLFLYGGGITGGRGGDSASLDNQSFGGDGGTGYIQQGQAPWLKTYDSGASAGVGGHGEFGNDGDPGIPLVVSSGTTNDISATGGWARETWTTTPLREGEDIEIVITGFQDQAWMFYSFAPENQVFPEYQGALTLGPPLSNLIYLGEVPLLATYFQFGTVPELPAGFDVFEVHIQIVMQVGGAGFNLAAPEHIVLLDSAF